MEFDAVAFCSHKATGTYTNDNFETVECDNDSFNGGWTMIYDHTDPAPITGDVPAAIPNLPFWYQESDAPLFNQYLWVDSGTYLDFAVNSGSWHSEGFDAEKHVLVAAGDRYLKIRDRG